MVALSKSSTRVTFLLGSDKNMTEPMGIGLLSALAKKDRPGRETQMVLLSDPNWFDRLRDFKPHIVAASSITGEHKRYLAALKATKEAMGRQVFTMLGGPYAYTYFETIKVNEFLDATGVYECDEAWPQFLDTFEGGGDIHSIPNILTRENHSRAIEYKPGEDGVLTPEVITKFKRPRFGMLDDLPFMDRRLITEGTSFVKKFKRSIMAGRGCPHRCTYCFEEAYNKSFAKVGGKMLQRFTVDRLIAELEELVGLYDTRYIKFYDDVFPSYFPNDRAWLEEFAEKYPKKIGLPFHLLTRADIVHRTPEVLHLLKKAGIQSITMSIESGNRWIRDFEYVRDMTEEDMVFSFALAEDLGIETFANTILGCPAPHLPPPSDPRFDDVVAKIGESMKYYRKHAGGKKLELESIVAYSKAWFKTEIDQREFVDEFLRKVGIHRNQLGYDGDSARFNLWLVKPPKYRNHHDFRYGSILPWTVAVLAWFKAWTFWVLKYGPGFGPSFGEFPILFPYPGTAATKKLIAQGYFDGNFDALHESYQNKSPLVGCFTEYEKSVQQNLALLTTFCMLFTGSKSRVMRWIGWPVGWLCIEKLAYIDHPLATEFYGKLYAWTKAYMHETRVYPMKKTWEERVTFVRQMLGLDRFKQFGNKKPEAAEMQPGRTLGGPPPNG